MVLSVHNGKAFWFPWAVLGLGLGGGGGPLIFNFKTNSHGGFIWGLGKIIKNSSYPQNIPIKYVYSNGFVRII